MDPQLLIFYSSNNAQQNVVDSYHSHAAQHARDAGKQVSITDVDVDTADDSQLELWNRTTLIECVGVSNGAAVDRAVNPTLPRLEQIVDAL
jgi:hypothetical protein